MSGHDPGQLDRNEKRTLLLGLRSVNDWGAPEKWSVSALFRKRGDRHIRGWAELATHVPSETRGKTAAGALIPRCSRLHCGSSLEQALSGTGWGGPSCIHQSDQG